MCRVHRECRPRARPVRLGRAGAQRRPQRQHGTHDQTDRLYDLALAPNEQVQLPAPNKRAHGAGTGSAGLVRLQVTEAGSYRISVGSQMWVDLASGSMRIGSSDFAGQHGCDAPHKIVRYDLQPGSFVLQLSGGSGDHVRVAVTRVPRDR